MGESVGTLYWSLQAYYQKRSFSIRLSNGLWDYCAERRALLYILTPRNLFQVDKQSHYQFQHGVQGDISNLCSFGWYDWCYYREEAHHLFPNQKELLGRVLGPSKNEGNQMA